MSADSPHIQPPQPLDGPGWEPLREGVRIRVLHEGDETNPRIALLHYRPGARVPVHRHEGDEHIYVLEGAQADERGHYPAGTYVCNPRGSRHSVHSREGCLVLIYWRGPVVFEDPAADHATGRISP